jgi:hypothetical protein
MVKTSDKVNQTFSVCYVPHSLHITRSLGLEACLTKADYVCMSNHLYSNVIVYIDQQWAHKCKDACLKKIWSKAEREDPFPWYPGNPKSKTYLFYVSTKYALEEEYPLFDFNAIVASLGGSLGLFLGFSFLETARPTLRIVVYKIFRNRNVIEVE